MVDKFTGTGFNANALNLDFLRDQEGNPLKTPNSFLVLHNPVRQKCNEIIDQISNILVGNVSFSTVKVGDQTIQEEDINNWNTVFGNNHSHSNKSNLDTINQSLGSGNSPNFAGLAVNSNTVWHAGNDGAGSGLDADLLDGQQGSYYLNTTNITEGSKLFYTDVRARAAISENITGFDYNNSTGVFSLSSGYQIPTTNDINNWNTAYTNNHNHTNKSNLDTINQNLASINTPLFAGLTANNGSIIANSNPNESFLIGRCSSSIGNIGGIIIDQGSNYRARFNATGTALSTGIISFYYEKASDKTLGAGSFNFDGFNAVKISNNLIWHAGNDGTGSGLDADLLDGQQGSYYLNTTNMTEGAKLFYTDVRAIADITGLASLNLSGNLSAGIITSNKIGVGSYDALTLYRDTSGIDRQSILFKSGNLEMARISAELLTSQTANLVFQLCNTDRFVLDITGGAYVINSGYTFFGIKAGVGSNQDLGFNEGTTLTGLVRSGSPNQGISLENRVNANIPFLRINNSGAIELYSKSSQDIILNAANKVNITGGSLAMNGYEVIDQNRLFTIDKLQPRSGSFIIDTKTHGYGLLIKADSETTNETGTLIVNQQNIADFYGYNYSTSQFSDMRFGGTKKLYYSQNNLAFGIDTTNPQYLLDVNGLLNAQSGLYIGGVQALSAGRVGHFVNATEIKNTSGNCELIIDGYSPGNYSGLRYRLEGSNRGFCGFQSDRIFLYNQTSASQLEALDSGAINLVPTNSQDVNISSGSLKMAGTPVIDSTRKGLFNGLVNSSLMRTTSSATEAWYRDLADFSSNTSSLTGSIIIQTNIPHSQADMIVLRLLGYDYSATYDSLIDITIGGYAYTSGYFIREAYISKGKRKLFVRSAKRTSDSKLVLIIGETTDVFAYPKLKIDYAMLGYGSTEAAASGWTITISNDLSAYSNLTYLHEGSAYVLKSTNSNIIPDTNNAYDIGSSSYKFKNLYMSGDIQANKGNFLDDLTINKATGNPSIQWQSASSSKMQMYYDVTNTQGSWQNITSSCYVAIKNDGEVLIESKSTKDIKLVAAQNVNIQTGGLSMGGSIVLNSNRTYTPPSIADTSAANNTLYYSSTQSKLCYKDYGGTVHTLY